MIGLELFKCSLLLLSLAMLQSFVHRAWPDPAPTGKSLSGLLFGLAAVAAMLIPMRLAHDVNLEPSSVIVSVAAFWGGPAVGVGALTIAAIYGLFNDANTLGHVTVPAIFIAAVIGLVFRYILRRLSMKTGPITLLLFGGVVQVGVALCVLLPPGASPTESTYNVLIAHLLVFPPATVILGLLLADLDNRLKTEREIRDSEIRFRDLASSTGDFFFELNADGLVTGISDRFEEITGLPSHSLEGRLFRRLVDWDAVGSEVSSAITALREKKPFKDIEIPLRLGDARQLWLRASVHPVFTKSGKFTGFRGAATNITNRVWERNTLAERERRLNALYDNMQEGLVVYQLVRDRKGDYVDYRIIDANPAFERQTGLEREGCIGRLASLVYGTGKPPHLEKFTRIASSGQAMQFEAYFETLGRHLTISAFGLDHDIVVSVFRDVTASVRAMEKLRASETRFRDFAECSADWFFEQNADGVLTYLSDRFEQIIGVQKELYLGKKAADLIDPIETPQETKQAFREARPIRNAEAVLVLPNGQKKWIRTSANPLLGDKGEILGYHGTATEITAVKNFQAAILKERDRARLYFDMAGTIMLVLDRDGIIREINRRGQEVLGRSRDDLIGKNWFETAVPPQEVEKVRAIHDEIMAGKFEIAPRMESVVVTHSGTERVIAWTNSCIKDEDGRIVAAISSGEDITERQKAEAALRESEENFRKMFETSSDAMVLRSEASGRFEDVNPAALELYGFTRKEFLKLTPMDISADIDATRRAISRLEKIGRIKLDIRSHKKKDGTVFPVELSVWMFKLGGIPKYVAAMRDISERVAIETALRENEARVRAILEASPNAIFLKDREGRYVLANPAFCTRIGLPLEQVIGKKARDVRPTEVTSAYEDHDLEVFKSGRQSSREMTVREHDGRTHTYLSAKYPIVDSKGNISGLACVSTDISDRIKAEAERAESEYRYRTIIETVLEGVWETGPDGETLLVNDRLLEMFGCQRDEMLGRSFTDFVDADWKERARKLLDRRKEGVSERQLFKFVRRDGRDLWTTLSMAPKLDSSGHFESAVALVTDMTQQRRLNTKVRELEDHLSHVSRISQAGELATSFAHQLNQPLAAAGFYAQGLLDQFEKGTVKPEEIARVVATINDQIKRASEAITRIRTFVRRRKTTKEPVALNDVVREVVDLLRTDLQRFDTDIRLRLASPSPVVLGDPVLLQQVLINLAHNAVEALADSESHDRKIVITTSTNRRGEAVLRVRDHGPGLGDDARDHLFETFFTTKPEGLGMGLAICHTIVEGHEGKIQARNHRSGGAVFEVIIPAARGKSDG